MYIHVCERLEYNPGASERVIIYLPRMHGRYREIFRSRRRINALFDQDSIVLVCCCRSRVALDSDETAAELELNR